MPDIPLAKLLLADMLGLDMIFNTPLVEWTPAKGSNTLEDKNRTLQVAISFLA